MLEEENQRLREEIARLKALPKRPQLAPGSLDKASELGCRLAARGLPDAGTTGRAAGGPRRSPRNPTLVVEVPPGSHWRGFEPYTVKDWC